MKATEHFKQTIRAYLAKESKNMDDCMTFILNQVKRSGCMGFSDEEVYSLAVHYFDEDDIEVGKPVACDVIVNHAVELTEEEKAQARQEALKQYQAEQLRKMQQRTNKSKTPKVQPEIQTPSLFDF